MSAYLWGSVSEFDRLSVILTDVFCAFPRRSRQKWRQYLRTLKYAEATSFPVFYNSLYTVLQLFDAA